MKVELHGDRIYGSAISLVAVRSDPLKSFKFVRGLVPLIHPPYRKYTKLFGFSPSLIGGIILATAC